MNPSRRRALLEIFKQLSAFDLLKASLVCQLWRSLATDDEIWLSLLGEEGNKMRLSLQPVPTPIAAYRLLRRSVYAFRDRHLLRYDLYSHSWTFTPVCTIVDPSASLTSISVWQLFCCGGDMRLPNPFIVDVRTGAIIPQPPMKPHRPYPGVRLHQQFVYCFAGDYSQSTRNCDRFNLMSSTWEPLPNCNYQRHAFNPVTYKHQIYLPGGCCPSIEIFDTTSLSFTLLPTDTRLINSTTSFITGNQLTVVGLGQAYMLNLETQSGKLITMPKNTPTAWSTYDPMQYADELVVVWSYGGRWVLGFIGMGNLEHKCIPIPMVEGGEAKSSD